MMPNGAGAEDSGFEARCLLRAAKAATLATQSGGQPFASLVTPAVAPDGTVLLLLSSLAAHTRHLVDDPRCALLVSGAPAGPNPQTAPRLTVTGAAHPEPDPHWRGFWLARHPYAAMYAGFTDFGLWRLVPEAGHYVAGFARFTGLPAAALLLPKMTVGSVGNATKGIVEHCNVTHPEALSRLANRSGVDRFGAEGVAGSGDGWRMLGVDPDGLDLVREETVLRVAFGGPVADGAAALAEVSRLIGAAQG